MMSLHGDAVVDGLEPGEVEFGDVKLPSLPPLSSHGGLVFDESFVGDRCDARALEVEPGEEADKGA